MPSRSEFAVTLVVSRLDDLFIDPSAKSILGVILFSIAVKILCVRFYFRLCQQHYPFTRQYFNWNLFPRFGLSPYPQGQKNFY